MNIKAFYVCVMICLWLFFAGPVGANHQYHNIECEMTPDPECCTAVTGSGGNDSKTSWWDNGLGHWDANPTVYPYNGYHCFNQARGRAQLYKKVIGYTHLNGHGTASKSCVFGL